MPKKEKHNKEIKNFIYCPLSIAQANLYIAQFHRHNKPVKCGAKFAIGIMYENKLIGVGIAGRPIARHLDNKKTIEILRVAVQEGYHNASSAIYGRMRRICLLLGYSKIITYTLSKESGASMRALGAKDEGEIEGRGRWTNRHGRIEQEVTKEKKHRWLL